MCFTRKLISFEIFNQLTVILYLLFGGVVRHMSSYHCMSYFTSCHIGHFGSWKMSWIIRKLIIAAAMCLLSISNLMVCAQSFSVLKNGCCFNGTDHEVGDIVAENQDSCLRFICGLDKGQHPSIVEVLAVEIPPDQCTGTPCRDCFDKSCVDESGMIRSQGSSWQPNDCSVCSCGPGQIVDCKALPITCPPQPSPSCVKVPGQCCPIWDCVSNHCVDDEGIRRKLNEEWGTPCILHLCTPTGIATRIEDCGPIPVLNKSCELFTPEGRCCPELKCGCLDEEGKVREINEKWSNPGSPCFSHICTSSGTQTSIEDCFLPVANASCQVFTPEKQCCPELKCGCLDDEGQVRELDEEWGSPCQKHICSSNGIITRTYDCNPSPFVNSTCKLFTPDDQCCPELRCGDACKDNEGKFRALGEKWSDRCDHYTCTLDGIITAVVDCPFLSRPLDPTCQLYTPKGACCPQFKCGGCLYNDNYYEVGEEFSAPGNPCLIKTCLQEGIIINNLSLCPYLRPNPWCVGEIPEGECCFVWTCSGCSDVNGAYIPLGNEWETDPCTSHVCTDKGRVTTKKNCTEARPQPNLLCRLGTPEGECCPKWICPDHDPCIFKYTLANGTELENACVPHPEAPHHNCELHVPVGGCCQEWECGQDCRIVGCVLPEKPDASCVLFTPRLGCCPQLNCSNGCVDDNGDYHRIGEVSTVDPCTVLQCVSDEFINMLVNIRPPCPVLVRPPGNCSEFTPPGKCCQEWKCGEDCNFVDCEDGPKDLVCIAVYKGVSCCPTYNCSHCIDGVDVFPIGEEWDVGICTKKKCTNSGIETTETKCSQTERPNDTCYAEMSVGVCCPVWICGCLDSFGGPRMIGSRWKNDCISYECVDEGLVHESPVQCILDEPDHFNCIPFTPIGECCPKWNCGTNCAVVLCVGPPQEDCVADPLPPLSCCPTFSCPLDSARTCEMGSVWQQNCLTYNCTTGGIKVYETPCFVTPPPHEGCELMLVEGKCCLEWDCLTGTDLFPDEAELVIPVPP